METASVVAPGLEPQQWPEFDEWRGGRLDAIPPEELEQVFVGSLQIRDEEARFLGGESLGEALDRVLPAFDRLLAEEWETALAVFHGGVNRILVSHALAGGRTYFGNFEQAPACINVLDHNGRHGLDRAHGQLHPVRPAAPRAHDHDGAPLVGAEGVARRTQLTSPFGTSRTEPSPVAKRRHRSVTNAPQLALAARPFRAMSRGQTSVTEL